MNQRLYILATWLMWLALPLTASTYLRVWDRLPRRMAVHFDITWQPNGWTSREGALYLGLGVIAFMLVTFTVGAYAARAGQPKAAWPLMVMFYLILTGLWLVNNWIAHRNLNAQPSQSALLHAKLSLACESAGFTVLQLHS